MSFKITKLVEFERDFKKLLKRFRTLEDDFNNFVETQLYLYHKQKIDNGGIFRIPELGFEFPKVYKAKKFSCKSLKGKGSNTGIRIIYSYFDSEDRIEFVEIYYKQDKEKENRERIIKYYKK